MQVVQRPETYDSIIFEIVRGGTIQFETRYPINDPLASQIVSTLAHEMEGGFFDRFLAPLPNSKRTAARLMEVSAAPMPKGEYAYDR